MFMFRIRVRLNTWLASVAMLAVFLSVVSREAKRHRGWIIHGDILIVEVLEGLPGHPITGQRQVRSDGTIDLGYYGQLTAANLTTTGFKVALIDHLRNYLCDEMLGLAVPGDDDKNSVRKIREIAATDSDRVYVDFGEFCMTEERPICSAGFLDGINSLMKYEPIPRHARSGPCCPSSPSPKPASGSFMEPALTKARDLWDWVASSLEWSIRILSIPLGLCFLSTLERKKMEIG